MSNHTKAFILYLAVLTCLLVTLVVVLSKKNPPAEESGSEIESSEVESIPDDVESSEPESNPKESGTTEVAQMLIETALKEEGTKGGVKYNRWYGIPDDTGWCAAFISWCANECGLIEKGVIPKSSFPKEFMDFAKAHGQWHGRDWIPQPGAIAIFDWSEKGGTSHVGLVIEADGYYVYTIDGNVYNECKQRRTELGAGTITGYFMPEY